MEQTTIGQRIRTARKRAGLTQKQVSDRFGVSCQHVSNWEIGARSPKADAVLKMADMFCCDFYWLMFGLETVPVRKVVIEKYRSESFLREDITKYKEDNNEP